MKSTLTKFALGALLLSPSFALAGEGSVHFEAFLGGVHEKGEAGGHTHTEDGLQLGLAAMMPIDNGFEAGAEVEMDYLHDGDANAYTVAVVGKYALTESAKLGAGVNYVWADHGSEYAEGIGFQVQGDYALVDGFGLYAKYKMVTVEDSHNHETDVTGISAGLTYLF